MASADKELEEQLLEAGKKLLDPPSSVDELLPLLDRVESCLSRVEQSPSKSMQNAYSPSLNALITDKLLRNPDVDVKVAVASCISEITRITAPEAPYDDDKMKEVFQLIVSSFENLYDKSSRSYTKRASILETVAKVRSCVVMLDLECDALILEMFQHFLKAIREHHPKNVFDCMEIIMTLVVEESEDISQDLLSPILASVKKDNEEVLPIARKLAESVLKKCATKLKPYIVQAVNNLAISLDDYSEVLASICQDASGSMEQDDVNESKSAKEPLEESTQGVVEDAKEASLPEQDNRGSDRSPKSVMSNGIAQAGEVNTLADYKSVKKLEDAECSDQSKGVNASGNEESNDLEREKVDNNEQEPEQPTKRRGRKSSSSSKSAEASEGPDAANEIEAEKMLNSKSHTKEVVSSPHEDQSVEVAGPSENVNENDAKVSSLKVGDESDVVASPSSDGFHDENRSKKLARTKKKDSFTKEVATEDVSKKLSEGLSDSEAKPSRQSSTKALGRSSDGKKSTVVDSVKKGNGTTSEPDAKKNTAKQVDESNKVGSGSSSRQSEDKKRRGRRRRKDDSEVGVAKSSAEDEDKEMVSSPKSIAKSAKDEHSTETPKTNLKRKCTPGKDNESETMEYGENLVGSRVKVWWPDDQKFYKGGVDCFYSAKKKHKVLYDDGDQEILNLKKETWKFIEVDADSDEEEDDRTSPDASTDMPPKKKGRTKAGESTKQGKKNVSSKSGGASSSKSKGSSMKSSQKTKDGSKADSKSKGSKTVGKSEDEISKKPKDHTPKIGGSKSTDAAKKSSKSKNTDPSKISKSKDEDVSTPKSSAKSKQETPKTGRSKQETTKIAASSKVKPSKSGAKSSVNGTGKVKSGLSKTKDLENENSEDSVKEAEDGAKVKTSSSSRAGSEAKSGKKRRRN